MFAKDAEAEIVRNPNPLVLPPDTTGRGRWTPATSAR